MIGIPVSIIVPTYNERDNIARLLHRLDASLRNADMQYEVVIVDDDSPDRTWEVAREHRQEYPVTVVRRRDVKGLATAVLRGFAEASNSLCCVMDADLQHPPEKIPILVETYRADEDVDVVVGSRLTEDGGFGDSTYWQRAQTYCANLLAWVLFPATRAVSDVQSGYFVVSREIVDRHKLDPRGYKILLEILVMSEYGEVREVGYTFSERVEGESKLDSGTILDYLAHLGSLWRRTRGSNAVMDFSLRERLSSFRAPSRPDNSEQ